METARSCAKETTDGPSYGPTSEMSSEVQRAMGDGNNNTSSVSKKGRLRAIERKEH